jgi:hypothetical protein
MATEFKLSYTASDINERLGRIDNLAKKSDIPSKLSELTNDSGYATESYVNEGLATKQPIGDYVLKSDIPDVSSAIIDVTELPTENIRENMYYRKLTGSLVIDQMVQNAYTCHCVESLPETGLPATNLDQTEGHIYYTVGDGELYGYVDNMLSMGLGVPAGWYPGATLLGALGFGYSGVITNIMDDPKDGNFRLLLEYVIYSYKDSWTSHKTIGWAGTGPSSEIFNDPMNIASGMQSHAEGCESHAEGYASHAEGGYSHAEGYASHAEGCESHAEGYASHAEGGYSHAEGDYSHTEGHRSHAEVYASHAEGCESHAEGYASHAEGNYSHAVGRSQHVQGEYNLVDPEYNPDTPNDRAKYAHIVGNGTSDTARSNAHTIDWSGNAWFQGNVYVGGTGQDDSAAVKLAKISDIPSIEGLATESYVNTAVASLVNSAPEALNTLDELAAALGDDSNFATTVTNQIAAKQDAITGTAGQFVVIGADGKPTTKTILIAEEATF